MHCKPLDRLVLKWLLLVCATLRKVAHSISSWYCSNCGCICITATSASDHSLHLFCPLVQLDDGEDIEVEMVAQSKLLDHLQKLDHQGFVIFNGLYTFAIGMKYTDLKWGQ